RLLADRCEGQGCVGAELIVDLSRDGLNIRRGEVVFLAHESGEKQPVTQRVDPSWNASRQQMDIVEARGLELGIAFPSDMLEAVFDVGLRFGFVERSQVV